MQNFNNLQMTVIDGRKLYVLEVWAVAARHVTDPSRKFISAQRPMRVTKLGLVGNIILREFSFHIFVNQI